MSLHALAGHMATKGRGGDSMLVHMTPSEVSALQALAERHGGTLTINPETGQPEANFLKKILPLVAGVALGPIGYGLSAGMAGLAVGGATALATGSLSRGLMAGLGAYGGAGLGAGLANMGSSAVGADALAAANASADPIMSLTAAKDMATATGAAAPTGFSALTEGAKAAFNDPGSFVQNMGGVGKTAAMGLAAISPIMADEGVQTTTPKQDTGNIRRFSYDRFGQTFTPQGVFPAAGYTGMARGGIVALAEGGAAAEPLYKGLTAQSRPEDISAAYGQAIQGAGGDTQANQQQAIDFLGNLGIGQDRMRTAYDMFKNPAANTGTQNAGFGADQMGATQGVTQAPAFDPKLGVFQNVYDPNTGREFISPLQAGQYGVKDYTTEMPMKLDFLNDTSKKAVTDAMAGGATFDQALNRLGGEYGMSGKDFYNYEVQGGIRSRDTAPITQAVATESGGLNPADLTAKLQAFKDKPPTTAQEFREQQALYADYANRYANSSWNYANMGGKAQDYSLKPANQLGMEFTGYSSPVNTYLNMLQDRPGSNNLVNWSDQAKILAKHPEINSLMDELYKVSPELSIFNFMNPKYQDKSTAGSSYASSFAATMNNLAGDMERIGSEKAIQNFVSQQQNNLSSLPDAQGKVGNFNNSTMANPEYRALNTLADKYTPVADDAAWDKRVNLRVPRDSYISEPYRDPSTGKGLAVQYDAKTGKANGMRFIKQNGEGGVLYGNDPAGLIEAIYSSGIPLSAFSEMAKVTGSDVFIPSDGSSYYPEGLKNGIKFSDIASGKLANIVASDDWLNFMVADSRAKNTVDPTFAGGLNSQIDKFKNQQKIARSYLTDLSGNKTAADNKQTNMAQGGIAALAQGGIVALAAGGDYRSLTKDSTADQIASAYKQAVSGAGGDTQANQAAALQYLGNLGIGQDRIGEAYGKFQASPTYTDYTQQNAEDYFRANPNIDIAAETARLNANPMLVNQYISQLGQGYRDPTQTERGSGAFQYYDAFKDAGIDANELYAANKALNPDYSGFSLSDMQRAFGVAKQFDTYQYDSAAGDQLAKDIAFLKQYDAGNFGGDKSQQILDIARETGLSLNEATRRYDAARAAMQPVTPTPRPATPPVITTPRTNAPAGTTNPYGNTTTPGDKTLNPDGSITVQPNIPGRPYGGFEGMEQVRNAYTQGGGSLGYVNPAPKTMEEFNQRFNKQTGDSLAAYNYLMGQGANPVTQQRVGEIARPYGEAIMGLPVAEGRPNQKFIYQNGRYIENPNYVPVTYDTKGNRNVGMSSAEVLKGFRALPATADDAAIFDWVDTNKVSIAQLAAAMGISVGEAQRRMDAARKKTGATTATSVSDSSYGGGDSGPGPSEGTTGGFSGMTSADMDAAGTPSYAQGGVLPRRMALGGLGALAKGGVAELPDGAFVVPARITSELGNGSTNAGAQKLFAMEQRLLGRNAQPVNLGRYSGGGNLVRGKGDGVSDSVPATIGGRQPARIADGESVVSRKAVEKLGDGSIEAGARKLYAMMDRVQKARGKTTGKNRVAANTRADKYLPA